MLPLGKDYRLDVGIWLCTPVHRTAQLVVTIVYSDTLDKTKKYKKHNSGLIQVGTTRFEGNENQPS